MTVWKEDQGDVMSFLQRKLDPPKQPPLDGGCLPGTRETFLSDVETWLAPRRTGDTSTVDKMLNVLWVSGAPGAGKTACASTIISDLLKKKCAKFFVKRGHPYLMNPHTIWPSIASQLAELDRGVKLDLLEFLSGDDGHTYPRDAKIDDQFCKLICEPLKAQFLDNPMSYTRVVVVIDALEEFNTDNEDEWRDFLGTIVTWSTELPHTCKLVVTSRVEKEIENKLKGITHPLFLGTGDEIDEKSSDDIQHFFMTKFQGRDGDRWVDSGDIAALTQRAAGSFLWAATAADYVTQGYGNRKSRLKEVLENIHMAKVGDRDFINILPQKEEYEEEDEEEEEENGYSLFSSSTSSSVEDEGE